MSSGPQSGLVVCPQCCGLMPQETVSCFRCSQDFGPLQQVRPLWHVLTWLPTVRQHALSVHVRGRNLARLDARPPGRYEIGDGADGTLTVQWNGGPQVTLTQGAESRRVTLPYREVTDSGKVDLWLTCVSEDELQPCDITSKKQDPIMIRNEGRPFSLGSGKAADRCSGVLLDDPQQIDAAHALVAREPAGGASEERAVWLIDRNSQHGHGTFVNKKAILVHRLQSGDLVQIGGFAWVYSREEVALVPVRAIEGVRVDVKKVSVRDRLAELSLTIKKGEFVGVTGLSGAGKSTMLYPILRGKRGCDKGHVRVAGRDIDEHREWYRGVLGYVSQGEVVHNDLTAEETVAFNARLRNQPDPVKPQVEEILREVDLPRPTWSALPGRRSGGESKRVRTAAELIGRPQLLILDEPASGLDRDRESNVMRLLRSLSYRGCTVILVTHNLEQLANVDRILIFRREEEKRGKPAGGVLQEEEKRGKPAGGVLQFDGSPEELRATTATGDLKDVDLQGIGPLEPAAAITPARIAEGSDSPSKPNALTRFQRYRQQTRILLKREWTRVSNRLFSRLVVPAGFLPFFFALVIFASTSSTDKEMIGFLAILSVIWMGSSLSLMAIVDEWQVLEHERQLFLRLLPYMAVKVAVYGLVSLLQTLVFVCFLATMYWLGGSGHSWLDAPWKAAATLVLTGWAATGMGLCLSALCKDNRALANFLLPLVMMVQIVFSVHVATDEGKSFLYKVYGKFHWGHYDTEGKGIRAHQWREEKDGSNPQWHHKTAYSQNPSLAAARCSYLTITRYADILLRSFAYHSITGDEKKDEKVKKEYDYRGWQWESIGVLLFFVLGFPILATAFICLHEWRRDSRSYRSCIRKASKELARFVEQTRHFNGQIRAKATRLWEGRG